MQYIHHDILITSLGNYISADNTTNLFQNKQNLMNVF